MIFYVGATGLPRDFDTDLAKILKEAKTRGCVTFVDPVIPYRKSWEHLLRAMEWIDVFHCNDEEASSITNDTDVVGATRSLVNAGPKNCTGKSWWERRHSGDEESTRENEGFSS